MGTMVYIRQLNVGDIFIDELGERWMMIENHKRERFILSMESSIFSKEEEAFNYYEIVEKVSTTH